MVHVEIRGTRKNISNKPFRNEFFQKVDELDTSTEVGFGVEVGPQKNTCACLCKETAYNKRVHLLVQDPVILESGNKFEVPRSFEIPARRLIHLSTETKWYCERQGSQLMDHTLFSGTSTLEDRSLVLEAIFPVRFGYVLIEQLMAGAFVCSFPSFENS